jgi:hypothetical protein
MAFTSSLMSLIYHIELITVLGGGSFCVIAKDALHGLGFEPYLKLFLVPAPLDRDIFFWCQGSAICREFQAYWIQKKTGKVMESCISSNADLGKLKLGSQLITLMRRCAERNNWVAIPKVKFTLRGQMYENLHFVSPPQLLNLCFLNSLARVITIIRRCAERNN